LTKELPQFEPRPLFCRQERDTGLFGIIANKHGYEQRQDEDGSKQVESNEEQSVSLGGERLWLMSSPGNTFRAPHDIRPSLLGHDLE